MKIRCSAADSYVGTLLTRLLPLSSPFRVLPQARDGIYPKRSHAYVFQQNCVTIVCPAGAGSSATAPAALVKPSASRSASAFSLVEVVIALGIAAFCLVALLGLFPSGLKSAKSTTDQTAAAGLLANVALDLRGIPAGSNSSSLYGITLPAVGAGSTLSTNFFFAEDGGISDSSASITARYGVLLILSNPTTALTTARIQIYWPPTLSTNSLGNALGVIESVFSINRQ